MRFIKRYENASFIQFIKRHKVLFGLFLISIALMIKNSPIPYFFDPPPLISFVFDAPKGEFLSGVAQIVDIFASAYVTSLLFYYMVDYLPTIREEKKAKEIISPKLVSLYLYMSQLLAMIQYSAKKENLNYGENIEALDRIDIRDKTVYCKKRSFKNEQEIETLVHYYNILKDCDKYKTLILKTCSDISCTPSFSYCDTRVIHIISEIQLCDLFERLPEPSSPFLQLNITNRIYMGLGKGYQHLKTIYNTLATFVETRFAYEMIDISQEELQQWQKKREEFMQQYQSNQNLIDNQMQEQQKEEQ